MHLLGWTVDTMHTQSLREEDHCYGSHGRQSSWFPYTGYRVLRIPGLHFGSSQRVAGGMTEEHDGASLTVSPVAPPNPSLPRASSGCCW